MKNYSLQNIPLSHVTIGYLRRSEQSLLTAPITMYSNFVSIYSLIKMCKTRKETEANQATICRITN